MIMKNKNFFDDIDQDWDEVLSNTYKNTKIQTNILVKYDLKKFGLENFKKIKTCDSIIEQYEKNVAHLTDTDEVILTIKLKDSKTFDKKYFNSITQFSFTPALEDLDILINDYDVTPFIIHSLKWDLGSDYVEEILSLTFIILYRYKMFVFTGIEVSLGTHIGEINFSERKSEPLKFMDCVTFLNLKIYEPYIDPMILKELYEFAALALPNADIN